MDTLDIIIAVLVLIPALLGIKNGFLRSIFSLIGIIAGLFLATRYYDRLSSFLGFLNFEPKLLNLISFVVIILICYFILIYIAGKISRFNFMTSAFDKIAGAVFGLLKGLIIASLFLIVTTQTFNLFSKETIDKSKFYTTVVSIAPTVYNYVKQFFPDALNFYDELKSS